MTWGPMFMYYHCPQCGFKFEYALDMISEFGETFGYCPKCNVMVYSKKKEPASRTMQIILKLSKQIAIGE